MLSAKTMAFHSPARHESAFETLWEKERAHVWRLTARLSGSVDAADDLTQEVCLRALTAYPKFRHQSAVSTWLYRIAVNIVLRWREQQRIISGSDLDAVVPLVSSLPTPEGCALQTESIQRIHRALDSLPDDLRTPFLLYIWEGLKYREIAEVLELRPGTVMSRLHTARQRLRAELKEWDDEAF